MEETKQEIKEEIKQPQPQPQTDQYEKDYKLLVESFDKLIKENELIKKEIMNLKTSGVNVSPEPKEIKKHEVNEKLWKETF